MSERPKLWFLIAAVRSVQSSQRRVPILHAATWLQAAASILLVFGSCVSAFGGYVVGIDFVDAPVYNAALGGVLPTSSNIEPYDFFDPSTPFADALTGVSPLQFENRVVQAVQEIFRDAQIGRPDEMLNIHIVSGPVDSTLGTILHIGDAQPDRSTLAGISIYDGANTRPDLTTGEPFYPNNAMSATLVDTIAGFGLTYDTFDEVVNVVAGTTAHEIAHTLGVAFDVPSLPVNGIHPIMATGLSVPPLPLEARKSARQFLDQPNTQPDPDFGIGAPRTLSVTDVLLQQAGTMAVTDFNFDGQTDISDLLIWMDNKFQTGTSITTGDANNDGVTDVSDLIIWNNNKFTTSSLGSSAGIPEPSTLWLLIFGMLLFGARPTPATRGKAALTKKDT